MTVKKKKSEKRLNSISVIESVIQFYEEKLNRIYDLIFEIIEKDKHKSWLIM